MKNKVAVITGGSSGIGLATARRFIAEGAHVFITGRRQSELDQAKTQLGGNVTAVQGDVANLDDPIVFLRCEGETARAARPLTVTRPLTVRGASQDTAASPPAARRGGHLRPEDQLPRGDTREEIDRLHRPLGR